LFSLTRERKPVAVDINHMRTLHEEAIEQLELMKTVLDAREESAGTLRDTLDDISTHHWHAYMDIIHLITLHDEAMANVIKKYGLALRDQDDEADDRLGISSALLTLLLIALIRRHRRIWHIYGWRASPMGDYLKESLVMEREHVAELITMVQTSL
jgi:hypothetical protein